VTTVLWELTRYLHRVYPLEISQTDALLLVHEEKNPLLTGGMEFKPAGVENNIRVPTDVKETVKNRSGRGVQNPIQYGGLVKLEFTYNTAIAVLSEYLKQNREWLTRLVQKLEKTCLLIYGAIPDDSNFNTKETEKLSKYNDLEIEDSGMWSVRIKIVPFITGVSGKIKKGLDQNLQLLPGHR
jgi:hypothetical protein